MKVAVRGDDHCKSIYLGSSLQGEAGLQHFMDIAAECVQQGIFSVGQISDPVAADDLFLLLHQLLVILVRAETDAGDDLPDKFFMSAAPLAGRGFVSFIFRDPVGISILPDTCTFTRQILLDLIRDFVSFRHESALLHMLVLVLHICKF